MFQPSSSRLFLKLVVLCLLATCLVYFNKRASFTRRAEANAQVLTVKVEPQPESPLQITSTKILSSDPYSPNVEFTVTNKGAAGIRAFTVTRNLVTDGGDRKAALFTHLANQRSVLQPGKAKTDSINEPYSPSFVNAIILSIDFVEFVNGKTWGRDSYNSAERLAGQRAGGGAALEHFRQALTSKGSPALLEDPTSDESDVPVPEGHSPEWQDGFKTGAALVRVRLKKAKQEGGAKRVEAELQQLFDAVEGRPQ